MVLQGSRPESAPGSAAKSEIFSDEQIEQLLQEAKVRLQQASELAAHAPASASDALEDQHISVIGSVGRRERYVCNTYHKVDRH